MAITAGFSLSRPLLKQQRASIIKKKIHQYVLTEHSICEKDTGPRLIYTSQTTLLTVFLLTELIEVTADSSGVRYGKTRSIFLIMCINQRQTAEHCKYFLLFVFYAARRESKV